MKLYFLAGKSRKYLFLAIMSASWLMCGTMQALAVKYNTIQIDQINNAFTASIDINNSGQIVYSVTSFEGMSITNVSYLYCEGIITKLSNYLAAHRINDNGEVVYRANDGNDIEIYLYSNNNAKQVTFNNYDDGYPDINNSGLITWAGRYSPNYKIYLYDGLNIQEISNISPSPGESDYDFTPRINNIGQIVWPSFNDGDYEIYLYSNGITSKISNGSSDNVRSRLNNKGDIVWDGLDGNDREIYLYQNGSINKITNNSYDDLFPVVNDDLHIAWKGINGNTVSIFHYYNGVTEIVWSYELQPGESASSIGVRPVINNIGQIAWVLSANSKVTVYLAKPSNVSRRNVKLPGLLLLLN